jgi:hypothetical protein
MLALAAAVVGRRPRLPPPLIVVHRQGHAQPTGEEMDLAAAQGRPTINVRFAPADWARNEDWKSGVLGPNTALSTPETSAPREL